MEELEKLITTIDNMILGYTIGLSTVDDKYFITKDVATQLTECFIDDLKVLRNLLLQEENENEDY